MSTLTIGKIEIVFDSKLTYIVYDKSGNVIQSEESVSEKTNPEDIVSELLEEINEHIQYNEGLIWDEF